MERFWRYVDKSGECWEWQSAKNHRGYGLFTFMRRQVRAHRFAWEMVNGPIPKGLLVLHHCDNPGCVNPSHLYSGTHRENMRDRSERGRQARGEKHGRAKVTESQVRAMRAEYESGKATQQQLAEKYGISNGMVSMTINRKHWAQC